MKARVGGSVGLAIPRAASTLAAAWDSRPFGEPAHWLQVTNTVGRPSTCLRFYERLGEPVRVLSDLRLEPTHYRPNGNATARHHQISDVMTSHRATTVWRVQRDAPLANDHGILRSRSE
jgi:hypothetical protein